MSEFPILFADPMVCAILDARKSQMRCSIGAEE
ncbi:hypothetical protein BBQ_2061 [Burkholderia pseudomallei MSHR511]|nr:hypothetical protein BBS_127 [Burkholderia pseudomallei NAU20B-16]AHG32844.1 hypothetical protein BBQ_2061 [Burkholderia pseudomallei MSHR511]AHG66481.1 hypothetical protein BBN_2187 [Burkholderia pseudomallei MSHR146]AIS91247.1 hypothetical protein BBU_5726 [Burkholderia pseudomallei NAU35A-3]KGV89764.1 hypothetical protein X897_2051 [Burkholderia pseudomallei ABCPW 30]